MTGWEKICKTVGKEVQTAVGRVFGTESAREELGRGAGGDITVYVDKVAEDAAVKALEKSGKGVILISEELGEKKIGNEPEAVLVLDPLDGTNNAKRGIPFIAVSLGVVGLGRTLGETRAGYVRNLITGDEWFAEKGKGALFNGKKCVPSRNTETQIIGTDLHRKKSGEDLRLLSLAARNSPFMRIMGAASLGICFVANGASDAYYHNGIRTLDMCAGKLIVEEAGGIVTGFAGRSIGGTKVGYDTRTDVLASGNAKLHEKNLRIFG